MVDTYVDLHIHSGLSPCAEEEMTPNNIVNMALIKGLDMISITDHNAIDNVLPAINAARNKAIIVIPGIEITTQEEAHLLAYFPTYQALEKFYHEICNDLPDRKNRPDIFGRQLIFNDKDDIIGEDPRLLMNALQLSFDRLVSKIIHHQGAAVPSHVLRNSFSVYSQMGYIPEELPINTIEIGGSQGIATSDKVRAELKRFKHIISSDAHCLANILERVFFIELIDDTTDNLVSWLRSEGGR